MTCASPGWEDIVASLAYGSNSVSVHSWIWAGVATYASGL